MLIFLRLWYVRLSSRTSPLDATLITSICNPLRGVGLVLSNNSVLHTVGSVEIQVENVSRLVYC